MRRRRFLLHIPLIVILVLISIVLNGNALAYSTNNKFNDSHEMSQEEEKAFNGAQEYEDDSLGHLKDTFGYEEDTRGHEEDTKGHEVDTKGHEVEVPILYLFFWGILLLVMVIILIYFVVRYKHGQKGPIISLALFFVILVLAAYFLETTPILSKTFDSETLTFISKFHEDNKLGFLRFVYKFLLGIFLTLFAFLNMDRERFLFETEKNGEK